jgi:hypothetical protein
MTLDRPAIKRDQVIIVPIVPDNEFCGRLFGEDGKPLDNARVALVPREGPLAQRFPFVYLTLQHRGRDCFEGVTDCDGVIRIRAVPPGTYRVVLKEEQLPVGAPVATPFENEWIGCIAPNDNLYGLVVDSAGKGIPRANVLPLEGARLEVAAFGQGGFRIDGLSSAPAKVMVVAPGYMPVRLELTRPRDNLVVVLDRLARHLPVAASSCLVVWVSWDGAVPASEGALVTFRSTGGSEVRAFTVGLLRGWAEIAGLAPGRYDLTFELPGFLSERIHGIALPREDPIEICLHPAYGE